MFFDNSDVLRRLPILLERTRILLFAYWRWSRMRSPMPTITRLSLIVVASLVSVAVSADNSDINMPVGVTPISKKVYGLHMQIFWICCVIGVLVFGVMFYSMFKHRKSKGHKPANFHESTKVEIVWTTCLLYTSPSPRDATLSRMPSSA